MTEAVAEVPVPVPVPAIAVPTDDAARPAHRRDIQGLRAIAVLLVIGNHAHVPGFGGGYAGVDVFFVISGFVITQQVLRETGKGLRRGLVDFYARRARRIVPAATATLVGTLLAARWFLGSDTDPALFGDVRASAFFGANLRLISNGSDYFVPGIAPSLVTQFWSLAVEEQFYLVFPLLVFATAKLAAGRGTAHLPILTLGLVPLVAVSAWWSAHSSPTEAVTAYYSPFTRFWELGAGCLLAIAMARPGFTRRPGRSVALLGLWGLVITLVVLPGAPDYPGTLAWWPVLSALLLLAAGGRGHEFPDAFLSSRAMTWIGDRSYALYLWHWLWLNLPSQLATPHEGFLWRVFELAGATATAALTYRWLEDPVRRSRRLAADPVAAGLLLAVCLAGVVAATLLVSRLTPTLG